MKRITSLILALPFVGISQFSDVPESGNSDAIHKDSSVILSWALTCSVQPGLQDIADPNSGLADFGDEYNGVEADGLVVSLGDSGIAILSFANGISNGPGPDLAVFENSFSNTFLELAFVEVSSDGTNYFRFPATSNLPTTSQTGGFGSSDPTLINNLAGKYRADYGTPFDLDSIPDNLLLNKENITHVKIIDVIGDISGNHTSYDQYNNPINDPYPTAFGSGGFDLDGVAVIHEQGVGIDELEASISVYPNPVSKGNEIFISNIKAFEKVEVIDVFGSIVSIIESNSISTNELSSGIYFVQFIGENGSFSKKVLVR